MFFQYFILNGEFVCLFNLQHSPENRLPKFKTSHTVTKSYFQGNLHQATNCYSATRTWNYGIFMFYNTFWMQVKH